MKNNVDKIKVIDTVLVPVGMYNIGMFINIEMSTFRTGLNTRHVSVIPVDFGHYWPVRVSVGT